MLLNVTVGDGKYTVIQEDDGGLRALRYGEEWRDLCGDGMVLALAQEVEELRLRIENATSRVASCQYCDLRDRILRGEEE